MHSLQRLQDRAHLFAGMWEIFVMGSIFSGHPMLTWARKRRQSQYLLPSQICSRRYSWQSELGLGLYLLFFRSLAIWEKNKNTNMEEKMEGNIYAGVSSELMLLCISDRQRQSALSYPGTCRSHGCP